MYTPPQIHHEMLTPALPVEGPSPPVGWNFGGPFPPTSDRSRVVMPSTSLKEPQRPREETAIGTLRQVYMDQLLEERAMDSGRKAEAVSGSPEARQFLTPPRPECEEGQQQRPSAHDRYLARNTAAALNINRRL